METSLYYMHLQYVMCFSLYFFHVTFRLSTKIQIFRLLISSPLLIKSDIFIVHYDIIPGLYLPCDIIFPCAMLHLNFCVILAHQFTHNYQCRLGRVVHITRTNRRHLQSAISGLKNVSFRMISRFYSHYLLLNRYNLKTEGCILSAVTSTCFHVCIKYILMSDETVA